MARSSPKLIDRFPAASYPTVRPSNGEVGSFTRVTFSITDAFMNGIVSKLIGGNANYTCVGSTMLSPIKLSILTTKEFLSVMFKFVLALNNSISYSSEGNNV